MSAADPLPANITPLVEILNLVHYFLSTPVHIKPKVNLSSYNVHSMVGVARRLRLKINNELDFAFTFRVAV